MEQETVNAALNTAEVSAALNADEIVVLYDQLGHSLHVQGSEVDYWMGQGMKRYKSDRRALAKELAVLLGTAGPALDDFLTHGQPADETNMRVSMFQVEQAWGRLAHTIDIQADTTALEGAPVDMIETVNGEDVSRRVDPGQVALYAAQGWRKA